ncbi:hypothetical protein FB451DRAFT_1398800 [Mycena latifolia]|nr:hypothetical protein FB451DRAFT_1398800 [Mycena latifolia]
MYASSSLFLFCTNNYKQHSSPGVGASSSDLPIGSVSISGVFLLKASPPLGSSASITSAQHLSLASLSLALRWGGNTKAWNDSDVIACFVVADVLGGIFYSWEVYIGDRAMTPTSIFKLRSIWAILLYSFLTQFSLLLFSCYIPIFYQALVDKFGYYWPFLVGATHLLVEVKDAPRLLGQATSMGSFAQFFGGTIGLGVAEPVFSSMLGKNLLKYAPDAPAEIVKQSPTAIYTAMPAAMIPGVVKNYTESLKIVLVLGVPIAGFALLSAAFIKNIKIEKTGPHPGVRSPPTRRKVPPTRPRHEQTERGTKPMKYTTTHTPLSMHPVHIFAWLEDEIIRLYILRM